MSETAVHVPLVESGASPAPPWVRRPEREPGQPAIFLREFLDDLPPGSTVLDLGSGPGSFDYRRRDDWTVLATDILPLRPPAPVPPRSRWFRADAARLPLRDASVDGI